MATLYVVHQALRDTGTTSIIGTYTDRKKAERTIDSTKGGGLSSYREAQYFIQELSVEEVGEPVKPDQPTITSSTPDPDKQQTKPGEEPDLAQLQALAEQQANETEEQQQTRRRHRGH
jgi:hypothetical protein